MIVPARPVRAADLPKGALGRLQRDGRPNPPAPRKPAARSASPSTPGIREGSIDWAGWRCTHCDETGPGDAGTGYALCQHSDATGHHHFQVILG